jgi:hypothetical protein
MLKTREGTHMNANHLNQVTDLASNLLRQTINDDSPLKPSDFFCEGWLTALTIAVVNKHGLDVPPFTVPPKGRWWCEAGLRSRFKPKKRSDKRGEGVTWVDAVIGHFDGSKGKKRGIQIREDATHLDVVEAKLNSPLSKKTSNASGYDQAARNAACIAHELADGDLSRFATLRFTVVAPEKHIEKHRHLATRASIERKVRARIDNYAEPEREGHLKWYTQRFLPMMDRMIVQCVAWEEVIKQVEERAAEPGCGLRAFYEECDTST